MIPVVTPEEMGAIDAAAPEPVEVLIARAGAATARAALRLLGGAYGRRVVVVAGKGNNGNDGRDAAARLQQRGVRVQVIPAGESPAVLPPADLVVDAAYGTGFRGDYRAPVPRPPVGSTGWPPVLAVDIPSGVNGLTGEVPGTPLRAEATVTFAALKPGLVTPPGAALTGSVEVADIGLDVSRARAGLVERDDVVGWVPERSPWAHKWQAAMLVVAGSPGMTGAAVLTCASAARAGAGMVRYLIPGLAAGRETRMPVEAVGVDGAGGEHSWVDVVRDELAGGRLHSLVIGPGLGAGASVLAGVPDLLTGPARDIPVVVDGDGLSAVAEAGPELLGSRPVPAVLTPHDGEAARLAGSPVAADRSEAARDLARRSGSVVLLKGPTTVVACPDGQVRMITTGDERLATAGSGDVLSGLIGALLARGAPPSDAAAAGAWLHGSAASRTPGAGMVAGDIVTTLPAAFADLR